MNDLFKLRKTWISSAHQGFVEGNIHSNTLAAYMLAARKGADMIETDARTTRDGILIVNHDATVKGFDENLKPVEYLIFDTDYADIAKLTLTPDGDRQNRVPKLSEALHLAYFTGMCINIDLKEGAAHAMDVARLVAEHGMRGRTVYATNGSGAHTINEILAIDRMQESSTQRQTTRVKSSPRSRTTPQNASSTHRTSPTKTSRKFVRADACLPQFRLALQTPRTRSDTIPTWLNIRTRAILKRSTRKYSPV